MRKLATIEKIINIEPIPGADNIDVATIKGWHLVVKKGEFKIGDLCVYFEVDSLLPERPEFEFLRKNCFKTLKNGSTGFRIKTIRLRKQISSGLAFPLNILPSSVKKIEGTDVTKILGVKLYENAEFDKILNQSKIPRSKLLKWAFRYKIIRMIILPFLRKEKGRYPLGVPKTDEERIQNLNNLFSDCSNFKGKKFYTTEKIDYQSGTYFTKPEKFLKFFTRQITGVCSRKIWLKTQNNSLYWRIFKKYNMKDIFKNFKGHKVVIQGEQGNTKVQGNKYKITEPKMWVFNVIIDDEQCDRDQMEFFCKKYSLDIVPLIHKNIEIPKTIDEIVEMSNIKSTLNPKIRIEGLVWRCIEDGQKLISFKVLNPNFLLDFDE